MRRFLRFYEVFFYFTKIFTILRSYLRIYKYFLRIYEVFFVFLCGVLYIICILIYTMVKTKVKKYNIANDELDLKGKNGLYCFLPYERLVNDKAVFKCGMTTQEYASRIENYHTYYPMGLYLCFFLTPPKPKKDEDEIFTIRQMEKDLFIELKKEGGKMLKFETRPKGDFKSEWFYTSFSELDDAFESVHQKYKGSKIERYNPDEINKKGEENLNSKKKKYVAEIVYYV